jgi:hypothetical protein
LLSQRILMGLFGVPLLLQHLLMESVLMQLFALQVFTLLILLLLLIITLRLLLKPLIVWSRRVIVSSRIQLSLMRRIFLR